MTPQRRRVGFVFQTPVMFGGTVRANLETAAAVGSNNAAGYQLECGAPVMAIGGFNGTDPSPTLAQFQKYVADGKIHYFISSGTGGGMGGSSSGTSSQITSWVEANFKKVTVGSATFYDLTQKASS